MLRNTAARNNELSSCAEIAAVFALQLQTVVAAWLDIWIGECDLRLSALLNSIVNGQVAWHVNVFHLNQIASHCTTSVLSWLLPSHS